jgi:hypothetical protein
MSEEGADNIRIQEVVRETQTTEGWRIIEGQIQATNSHPPAKQAPPPPSPPKKQ